jgi:hypothetical protein
MAVSPEAPNLAPRGPDKPDPMNPRDVLRDALGGDAEIEGDGDAHIYHEYEAAKWFDGYAGDVPKTELPPYEHVLPIEITGADPTTGEVPADLFNMVALPRLRALFPYYYDAQFQRCVEDGRAVETSPEVAFESEALMLKVMIGNARSAVERASRLHGVAVMTLDNDITVSWKYDVEVTGGAGVTADTEFDSMSEGVQRSAYHTWSVQDLDATVTRPAVLIGAATLKEEYGDGLILGMLSSNTQDYLDMYAVRLNKEVKDYLRVNGRPDSQFVGDAFSGDEMISYTDGRYRELLHKEREMTRANKHATREEAKRSPSLQAMLSPKFSAVYHDAELFIDFEGEIAESISAQDLKVAALLHMREERVGNVDAIRTEHVHLDDMPSALSKDGPRLRYVVLPEDARFFAIDVEQWERGITF